MKFNPKDEKFYPTPRLVKLVRQYSRGKVLDVGCGTGEYFKFFKGSAIYGTDINTSYLKSIDKNKFQKKRIILKKADIRKLPFKDREFDFILSSLVLEYMKTPEELKKAISELKRVLKKNGLLIITTPHKNSFTTFVREYIISQVLPKERIDPNFIMGVARSQKDLKQHGFTTKGCLGWVTYRAINNEFLAQFLDLILWNIPFFSGTLIGIYKKSTS